MLKIKLNKADSYRSEDNNFFAHRFHVHNLSFGVGSPKPEMTKPVANTMVYYTDVQAIELALRHRLMALPMLRCSTGGRLFLFWH